MQSRCIGNVYCWSCWAQLTNILAFNERIIDNNVVESGVSLKIYWGGGEGFVGYIGEGG